MCVYVRLLCLVRMASVLFIIRVPYGENTEESEIEEKKENLKKPVEESNPETSADPNVKEVKFENDQKPDKNPDQNEAKAGNETNEADQTTDDVEVLAGPLNLAEVGFLTRTDISLILCINSSNRIMKMMWCVVSVDN